MNFLRVALLTRCSPPDESPGLRIVPIGPPTGDTLYALLTGEDTYDGVIVDLRECKLTESLIDAVVSVRRDLCRWICTHGVEPPRIAGVILIVGSHSDERALIDYAGYHLDCPSFWFVAGFEIVVSPIDDQTLSFGDGVSGRALGAFRRLSLHPFVSGGERAKELFREHRIDSLAKGRDAFLRRGGDEPVRELRIVLPSTYQLEGGVSIALPENIVHAVFRHVVVELTGNGRGLPGENTGFSLLEGRGSYFSVKTDRHVEEQIQLAQIHLEISLDQARSLARYLCFAWLQDAVFCTLDGKVVDP